MTGGVRRRGPLQVKHYDLLDYQDAWDSQEWHAARRREGAGPDVLMLLEHPPVYTAGKRTRPEHRPTDGTPVIDVDRGGLITWHGPGQLVGYPIIALREPADVSGYVTVLETALVRVCGLLGVPCVGGPPGRSGVWVDDPAGPPRKIAAIGVRVRGGVTTHGFALNCDPDLRAFDAIVPCGLTDAAVTSLTAELGRPVRTADVRATVEEAVRSALDALPLTLSTPHRSPS